MKLYEIFAETGFHTTVVTTFAVGFDAFEDIALSSLRGAWCRNVILIADAAMVGLALEDSHARVAGSRYLVAKATARGGGVFHPKVIVQLGRTRGRLIVTSANATSAGLSGNLELASVVECAPTDSGEQRLVAAGWRYVTSFLDQRQRAVADRLAWARGKTPWLAAAVPADGVVQLADRTEAAFLAAGEGDGIGARFLGFARGVDIRRLTVVSPFWDQDLAALAALRTGFSAADVVACIDVDQKLFPAGAVRGLARVAELHGFDAARFPKGKRRFVHAKLAVATSAASDHVLAGSANCTVAALGAPGRPSVNEEACLYRRLPAGRMLAALGLAEAAEGASVAPEDIPAPVMADPIPLGEAAARDPGAFERVFDRVAWWPPSDHMRSLAVLGEAVPELLTGNRGRLTTTLEPPPASGDQPLWLRLPPDAPPPAFGRVRLADDKHSLMVPVAWVDKLRAEARERPSKRADRAAAALEAETEETVELLGFLAVLDEEDAPPADDAKTPGDRRPTGKPGGRGEPDGQGPGQVLDFQTFMAGRRRRVLAGEAERNSLAGSSLSLVRGRLNRILGLSAAPTPQDPDEDGDAIGSALFTGDEVVDGGAAIEAGANLGQPGTQTHRKPDPMPQRTEETRQDFMDGIRQAELDRLWRAGEARAIAAAVAGMAKRIPSGSVPTKELLRLRFLLTVILVAGWRGPGNPRVSRRQVLPMADGTNNETWPRLAARSVDLFFGTRNPAILRVAIDREHDRLPDDILECLACCQWTVAAALAAARQHHSCAGFLPVLGGLAARVRDLAPLSEEEKAAPAYAEVFQSMERRFSNRLGLVAPPVDEPDKPKKRASKAAPVR